MTSVSPLEAFLRALPRPLLLMLLATGPARPLPAQLTGPAEGRPRAMSVDETVVPNDNRLRGGSVRSGRLVLRLEHGPPRGDRT